MAGWKVLREEAPHFVIQGARGEFKVHSGSLSPRAAERMRAMCNGGSVKKMAEGGEVDLPPAHLPNPDAQANPEEPGWLAKFEAVGEAAQRADQDRIAQEAQTSAAGINAAGTAAGDAIKGAVMREQPKPYVAAAPGPAHGGASPALLNQGPAAMDTSTALREPGDVSQPSTSSLPPMPPEADWDKAQAQLDQGQAQGAAGADLQAKAEAQKASDLATAYQQHTDSLKELEARRVADTQAVQTQIDRVITDIQGSKIDPNHFWADKSTGQKMVAALGMILSGIGSGLTGQPNMAAQFLQRQIDRDIDAQKANLGKKETLLGFMFKKYGNINDASLAAKSYLMAALAGQVGLSAARAGGLQAQANAEILKSQLSAAAMGPLVQIVQGRHQDALQRYQLAWQQRLMQQSGSTQRPGYIPGSAHPPMLTEPTPKGIEAMRKDDNERRVNLPALGQGAYTHAQTTKDAEESKQTLGLLDNLDAQVGALAKTAQQNSVGLHVPLTDARARYQSFASSLITELNKLQGLNRLNAHEYQEFGTIIPTEREWLTGQGAIKVQALRQHIQNKRMEEYREKLGLPVGSRPQESKLPGTP